MGVNKKISKLPLGEASTKMILNFKTRREGGYFCQTIINFGEQISKLPSWRGLQKYQVQLLSHSRLRHVPTTKPSKQSQAVRARKETQIKATRASTHMSTRSSKPTKPSKIGQAVRASKKIQIKAKRASIYASKAYRDRPNLNTRASKPSKLSKPSQAV